MLHEESAEVLLRPPKPKRGNTRRSLRRIALDGDGQNSPFAEALAGRLQMPNVDVRRVFDYVRDDVLKATHREQQPFTYGSLPPVDFYFAQK